MKRDVGLVVGDLRRTSEPGRFLNLCFHATASTAKCRISTRTCQQMGLAVAFQLHPQPTTDSRPSATTLPQLAGAPRLTHQTRSEVIRPSAIPDTHGGGRMGDEDRAAAGRPKYWEDHNGKTEPDTAPSSHLSSSECDRAASVSASSHKRVPTLLR